MLSPLLHELKLHSESWSVCLSANYFSWEGYLLTSCFCQRFGSKTLRANIKFATHLKILVISLVEFSQL